MLGRTIKRNKYMKTESEILDGYIRIINNPYDSSLQISETVYTLGWVLGFTYEEMEHDIRHGYTGHKSQNPVSTLKIATEYNKSTGGRFRKDGEYSGEDFRETLLRPKYEEARKNKSILVVDLDGSYGYASCFLEEAFGGLARELKDNELDGLVTISNDQPDLVRQIMKYIRETAI
jgi:hypothetical protein